MGSLGGRPDVYDTGPWTIRTSETMSRSGLTLCVDTYVYVFIRTSIYLRMVYVCICVIVCSRCVRFRTCVRVCTSMSECLYVTLVGVRVVGRVLPFRTTFVRTVCGKGYHDQGKPVWLPKV